VAQNGTGSYGTEKNRRARKPCELARGAARGNFEIPLGITMQRFIYELGG